MFKQLTFILIVFALGAGCVTQRRCLEKFPPDVDTVYQVNDTTIYRDTTIYVHIAGDTVYNEVIIEVPVEVPAGEIYVSDTAITETEFARGKAWVEKTPDGNQVIKQELIQKETDLPVRLDSAIAQRDRFERMYVTEVFKEPVKHIPLWIKIVLGLAILIIILAIGTALIVAIKKR